MSSPNWSDFAGFKSFKSTDVNTAFSDSIGGAFFEMGTHKDVTIESVEPKVSTAGNPYLLLVLTNEAGARINKIVMVEDREGGPSKNYEMLATALVADRPLRIEFFGQAVVTNPALLDGLRGLKLNITVSQGKTGYILKKAAMDEGFVIYDIETDAPFVGFETAVFEDYTSAKEAAQEAGIKRCWPEVSRLGRGTKDAIVANENTIRKIVDSSKRPDGNGVTQLKSTARRPAL